MSSSPIVVGVDVGGEKKGFHAVALQDKEVIRRKQHKESEEIATWCLEVGARYVGIDAPCGWSVECGGRRAEKRLRAEDIKSFYAPTEHEASTHRTDFYGWMKNGAALFKALEPSYPLYKGDVSAIPEQASFETFPHAAAWKLATPEEVKQGKVAAKNKRAFRSELLQRHGIANRHLLTSIDWIDAALCALTADFFSRGEIESFGEPETGLIVVPEKQK
ncbi:MAG: DUF429 domain-containing protein [Acidobacteriota bacterium]